MSTPLGPAVFLDRDGVLNRAIIRNGLPYTPSGLGELDIPPDVPGALTRLKDAGFALVMVTNQPDVARGRQTREMVETLNGALMSRLPLDEARVIDEQRAALAAGNQRRAGCLPQADDRGHRRFCAGRRL